MRKIREKKSSSFNIQFSVNLASAYVVPPSFMGARVSKPRVLCPLFNIQFSVNFENAYVVPPHSWALEYRNLVIYVPFLTFNFQSILKAFTWFPLHSWALEYRSLMFYAPFIASCFLIQNDSEGFFSVLHGDFSAHEWEKGGGIVEMK